MEVSPSIKELLKLRNSYEEEKIKLADKKDILRQKKKEIYEEVIASIQKEIDFSINSERLQKYLEKTNINKFNFLSRSLLYMPGNNLRGSLSFQKLLLLNDNVKSICLEYNITSESKLHDILLNYQYFHRYHPIFENDVFKEMLEKVQTLAYLDEFFRNIDNILDYQGAYTVYSYTKSFLKEVLKDDLQQTNQELIYKDYNQKLELVLNNLINIASYLFNIREQIPNSRLALCNQGLSRTAKKQLGTNISFDQKIFAKGIAFGTTLDKLKEGNYEDAKSLIFIPHQNLLK